MSFRVNQNMLNQNMLYNLSQSNLSISKLQQELSSGKKVSKPSDDPVSAVRVMTYNHSLNQIQQFKSNAQQGSDWMNQTDSSLNEVSQVLQRVRELVVQGASDTNDPTSKKAIADEITQLKQHLGEVANTDIAGKYIFAGTDTKTPPFDTTSETFTNTNTGKIQWQVGPNSTIQVNTNGTDIFNNKGSDGNNVFQLLDSIVSNLQNGTNISNQLGNIDEQVNNVNDQRSELGARINRMDLTSSRLDSLEQSTTTLLSNQQDTDIAQVITDLQTKQSVQQAALSVGARIIQPTLADFLK